MKAVYVDRVKWELTTFTTFSSALSCFLFARESIRMFMRTSNIRMFVKTSNIRMWTSPLRSGRVRIQDVIHRIHRDYRCVEDTLHPISSQGGEMIGWKTQLMSQENECRKC